MQAFSDSLLNTKGESAELTEFVAAKTRECFMNQVWAVFILVGTASVYLMLGTVFFANFEGWTFVDSFYFCCVTLGTVGYGGEGLEASKPHTKVFCIVYIYVSLILILSRAGALVEHIAAGTRSKVNAIAEFRALEARAASEKTYGTSSAPPREEIKEPVAGWRYYGVNAGVANALLIGWVAMFAGFFCITENYACTYFDAFYFAWSASPATRTRRLTRDS